MRVAAPGAMEASAEMGGQELGGAPMSALSSLPPSFSGSEANYSSVYLTSTLTLYMREDSVQGGDVTVELWQSAEAPVKAHVFLCNAASIKGGPCTLVRVTG